MARISQAPNVQMRVTGEEGLVKVAKDMEAGTDEA